jgi:hypothetical protein
MIFLRAGLVLPVGEQHKTQVFIVENQSTEMVRVSEKGANEKWQTDTVMKI